MSVPSVHAAESIDMDITVSMDMDITDSLDTDIADSAVTLSSSLKSVKIKSVKNTSEGIKITWSKSPGASGYIVYLSVYKKYTNGYYKGYGTIAQCYGESNLSFTDTSRENGEICTYSIYPYSGSVQGSCKKSKTIARVTSVKIKSLKSSSKKSMTIKWKKNSEATGYQIYCSTTKNFSKNTRAMICRGAGKISKKFKGMKAGGTYYVKIRAFKTYNGKRYYSVWSKVKKIKIKK